MRGAPMDVKADRRRCRPSQGFSHRPLLVAGPGSSGGNIWCGQPALVPLRSGRDLEGPHVGVTSTPVRLNASEVIRGSRHVSGGEGKSRCQGWSVAPSKGLEPDLNDL